MHIKYVFYRELFLRSTVFKFGNDKGPEIYDIFRNNSNSIISHMEDNSIWKIPYFTEIIFIINYIESSIFENNIKIFFVESPYLIFPKNSMSYDNFLEERYSFYKGLGEKQINRKTFGLYFCSTVLDSMIIYERKDSPFLVDRKWGYGKNGKKIAELHSLLQDNNEKIVENFGKSYRELTQLQLQNCFDDLFNRDDAKKHLVDALWLLISK